MNSADLIVLVLIGLMLYLSVRYLVSCRTRGCAGCGKTCPMRREQ